MISSVIILTNERDFAADEVIAHLDDLGASVVRVNIENVRSSPVASWDPVEAPCLSVVWWRQFEYDVHPADLGAADDILVERSQWRAWISVLDSSQSRWVNSLWAARRAENKVQQLRTAYDVGFSVPSTIITNDRDEALRFASENGDAIVKTLASAYFSFSDQSFVFTEEITHPALENPARWHLAPLIVQERLTGALDARVVSFGRHVFGARCQAKGLDWRKTPYDADLWSVWDVPDSIAARCAKYREHLGLEYAAFDFMVNDQIWFLEANQAGEFSFIDRALDLGISGALAEHLVTMASTS